MCLLENESFIYSVYSDIECGAELILVAHALFVLIKEKSKNRWKEILLSYLRQVMLKSINKQLLLLVMKEDYLCLKN